MVQFNRRNVLTFGFQAITAFTAGEVTLHTGTAIADSSGSAKSSTEKWMSGLTQNKSSDSPLYFGRFKEPVYFLTAPIIWKPNPNQIGKAQPVEAPAGFVTDLASVPSVFFSLLRPDDDYAYAAIIHDYLYWTQTRRRDEADSIIKYAMEDFNVANWKKQSIYAAVVAAGQSAWDNNARKKQAGEKRILTKYPPNARTTWSDWKRQPDVFAP